MLKRVQHDRDFCMSSRTWFGTHSWNRCRNACPTVRRVGLAGRRAICFKRDHRLGHSACEFILFTSLLVQRSNQESTPKSKRSRSLKFWNASPRVRRRFRLANARRKSGQLPPSPPYQGDYILDNTTRILYIA